MVDIWSTEWAQDEWAGAVCQSGLLFPFVPATWRSGLKKEKGVINSRRDSGEGVNSAKEIRRRRRRDSDAERSRRSIEAAIMSVHDDYQGCHKGEVT